VAVALVGGLHPAGVLLAALFFGGLVAGSNEMQRTAGVSSVIVSVIQGLVLLLLIAGPRARMRLPRGTEHEEALAADQRFDEEVTAERGQRGLASNSREEPR
jgi:ABC-type uncharacterized transport system permease subunit